MGVPKVSAQEVRVQAIEVLRIAEGLAADAGVKARLVDVSVYEREGTISVGLSANRKGHHFNICHRWQGLELDSAEAPEAKVTEDLKKALSLLKGHLDSL